MPHIIQRSTFKDTLNDILHVLGKVQIGRIGIPKQIRGEIFDKLSPRGVCSRTPHLRHFCRDFHWLPLAHVYAHIIPYLVTSGAQVEVVGGGGRWRWREKVEVWIAKVNESSRSGLLLQKEISWCLSTDRRFHRSLHPGIGIKQTHIYARRARNCASSSPPSAASRKRNKSNLHLITPLLYRSMDSVSTPLAQVEFLQLRRAEPPVLGRFILELGIHL